MDAPMWTTEVYLFIGLAFMVAGLIKGTVGLGFPTVILAMLSLSLGVREAMALMLLPCFLTNVWQAFSGGNMAKILRRIWPLLICASITIWLTTSIVGTMETRLLSCLLGLVVCTYALTGLTSPRCISPGNNEYWMTPVIGTVNGMVTGLTGTFVVPGVLYLQSLRMTRDALVQAMGILFLVSTTALGVGLSGHDLLNTSYLLISTLAVVPAFIGMALGRRVRRCIPEKRFARIFFCSLLLLGIYIIGNCFF